MAKRPTTDGSAHRFRTAVGDILISWRGEAITGLTLGGRSTPGPRTSRMEGQSVPPAWVRSVAARVAAHLAGALDPFDDIELDLSDVPAFHRIVYEAARAVHPGKTVSYGELAAKVGKPKAARAVGQAMRKNPIPLLIPCHRILGANGALGGFSAPGGVATKKRLLAIELKRDVGEADLAAG